MRLGVLELPRENVDIDSLNVIMYYVLFDMNSDTLINCFSIPYVTIQNIIFILDISIVWIY